MRWMRALSVSLLALESATNDGGAGMVQALGVKLLDAKTQPVGPGGGELASLAHIDLSGLDKRLADCQIEVACDVTTPLIGEAGASAVFGPRKGRRRRWSGRWTTRWRITQKLSPGIWILTSLKTWRAAVRLAEWGRRCCVLRRTAPSGDKDVTVALHLDEQVADANMVITGEGRIDSQTIHGKVPVGVARVAKRYNKPVIGIAGSLTADVGVVHQHGLDAVFSVIYTICSLEDALENPRPNVQLAARNIAAVIKIWGRGCRVNVRAPVGPVSEAPPGFCISLPQHLHCFRVSVVPSRPASQELRFEIGFWRTARSCCSSNWQRFFEPRYAAVAAACHAVYRWLPAVLRGFHPPAVASTLLRIWRKIHQHLRHIAGQIGFTCRLAQRQLPVKRWHSG